MTDSATAINSTDVSSNNSTGDSTDDSTGDPTGDSTGDLTDDSTGDPTADADFTDETDRFATGGHLDIHGNSYVQNPSQSWDELRSQCPVAHTTEYGVGWTPLTWDTIARVAYDPQAFSSRDVGVAPRQPDAMLLVAPPITADPPFHTDARRLLLPFFSAQAMEPMIDITRDIAVECLDNIAAELAAAEVAVAEDTVTGEAVAKPADKVTDVFQAYAKRIPVRVIASILGLPYDQETKFSRWAIDILQSDVDEVERRVGASKELMHYFMDLITERRAEPSDDLVSKLLAMKLPNGDPLTDQHIIGVCFLLLVAGIDTTQSMIGSSLHHLATHPDDRQRLVDNPEMLPTAIEEFLRAYSPVTMARVATEDTEIEGCPVKEGEKVYLAFGAGNRDPEKFERADEVVIDREENRHFAFGLGIHRCLGSNLARLELKVALEEWLKRFPDFELATDYDNGGVMWRGIQVRGPRHLYLRIA